MKMDTKTALRVVMTLSACAALGVGGVGCGGSSGGGSSGGGGGVSLSNPTKDMIQITEANAPQVVKQAEFLIWDGDDVDDFFPASVQAAQAGGQEVHTVIGKLQTLTPYQRAKEQYRREVSSATLMDDSGSYKVDCDDGGSVTMTWSETNFEMKFNNCRDSDEWSSDEYWKERIDGYFRITEISPIAGYDEGVRLAFDFSASYEEKEPGDPLWQENVRAKGSMDEYTGFWGSDFKLVDANFEIRSKGSFGSDSWDDSVGMKDFEHELNNDRETFSGIVGYKGDAGLSGAFRVETVAYLDWSQGYYGFPAGQNVVITGAGGSKLELRYSTDRTHVAIYLNEDAVGHFTESEYYAWLDQQ